MMKKLPAFAFSIALAFVASSCGEQTPSSPVEREPLVAPPVGVAISNSIDATALISSSASGGSNSPGSAWVSAAPGTFSEGRRVEVNNRSRSSQPRSAAIVDGGFDPVSVFAEADDELVLSVTTEAGTVDVYVIKVPKRRAPGIVRVNPSKGRTDVALNVKVEIVFTEPLDPSSINASTVRLSGTGVVAGTLTVSPDGVAAAFMPLEELQSGMQYTLVVDGVRDLEGDSIEEPAEITFTTAQESPNPIAPDLSGEMAFVSERDGNTEIYRANLDGSGLVRLTTNQGYDGQPAWSPDGTRIAFVSARSRTPDGRLIDQADVYVMNADGSNVTRITTTGEVYDPSWSSDGKRLAYEYDPYPRAAGDIAIVEVAVGESSRRLLGLHTLDIADPQWSPDGGRIAFVSRNQGWDVLTINPDGTGMRTLLGRAVGGTGQGYLSFSRPSWSPDSRLIASFFCRGSPDECERGIGILLAGEGPGEVTHLIDDGSWPYDPVWSPDGRAIIFASGWCLGYVCGNDIAAIGSDGTSKRLLVANGREPAVRPR